MVRLVHRTGVIANDTSCWRIGPGGHTVLLTTRRRALFNGFVALSGNELINHARVLAYSRQLGITELRCEPCDGLAHALGDGPYSSPDMDDAPWWDPTVPESKDFAGLLGLEIIGISKSTGRRELVPLTTDGAALHPLRRAHREIQIRALLLARTDCALSYGYSWLASALRGAACATGCGGGTLCFFTCCPPCVPDEQGQIDPACGDPYVRTLYDVGLLAMDEPTEVRRVTGGWLAQVTFTLAAGDPFIYREPRLIVSTTPGTPIEVIPDYDPAVSVVCTEDIDCLVTNRPDLPVTEWPACPPPPAPLLPPVPVDACFPRGPFTAARAVFPLPPGMAPAWSEKVPYLVIKSGSRRLERIIVRWYGNPNQRPCDQIIGDPCQACAEVNVAYIPERSTLTIDGRAQRAYLDCPGGPGLLQAEPDLYGPGGSPFVWPVFGCADALCLEVITKDASLAPDAEVHVYYVVREDAA